MNTQDRYLQAQYSVIGSMLIDPQTVPIVMAQTSLSDFQGICQTVYKAIKQLFLSGVDVDPVTVSHELGNLPEHRKFVLDVMEYTPTAANVENYIRICRDQSRLAAAQALGARLMGAGNLDEAKGFLDMAGTMLTERSHVKVVTMEEALHSFYERHTGKADYLSWPIPALNGELFCEPGDFIVIGGRPSAGKSAFALQCARYWAKRMKVGFFSLETSDTKLFDRNMAGLAEISMRSMKRNTITEEEWRRVALLSQEITATNLELVPAAGMTVADIRAYIQLRGYQLIIIDYMQLIHAKGEDRYNKVTNISLALHTMAQTMGVTVVALCQLSRLGQKAHPSLDDLRESGQIEQDADVVLLLSLEKTEDSEGPRILDVAKNKEGECPYMTLAFDGAHQTFSKLELLDKLVDTAEELKGKLGKQSGRKRPNETEGRFQGNGGQLSILPENTWTPFDGKDKENERN